jgi:uncharacterized membrane protein (UPF0127 family)
MRIAVCGFLCGCGGSKENDVLNLQQVIMPGGKIVQAELMIRRSDMMSGMMFRGALAKDRGLLFVHPKAGKYSYWMHNVTVPLDIIWMDGQHTIVEISANTPPCKEDDAVLCPHFGGKEEAQFVL